MIEWLEYVLLNAIFPGPSVVCAFMIRSFVLCPVLVLADLAERDGAPLDDAEDSVSSEFVPCSDSGIGGTASPGESRPFFVVEPAPPERPLSAKRPLAFGAEATRRMKRDAFAPIAFGESGPPREDGVVGVGGINESWDEFAVCGALRPSIFCCLSDRFLGRAFSDEYEEGGSSSEEGPCWK